MDTNWITLIGGIGIGSIISSVFTKYFEAKEKFKDRVFDKKETAYLGLLEAYHDAAAKPSDKSAKNYAYWQARVDLVGSQEVTFYAQKLVDTAPNSPERAEAQDKILNAMRKDLKIERNWTVK